jgi:hypothetical protein
MMNGNFVSGGNPLSESDLQKEEQPANRRAALVSFLVFLMFYSLAPMALIQLRLVSPDTETVARPTLDVNRT